METVDFTKLPAGTKVWSCTRGETEIEIIDSMVTRYPVKTTDGITYTPSGKSFSTHKHPTLFLSKQAMIDFFTNLPEPLPELAVDTPIQVRDNVNQDWLNRHFCRWSGEGVAICFDCGTTSWTNKNDKFIKWSFWRLPPKESEDK